MIRSFHVCSKTAALVLGGLTTLLQPVAGSIFQDNFESGLGQWTAQSPWALTTARFASPTRSATDSPGAFYTNNTDAALGMAASVNLVGTTRPALSFFHQYALETGYDFGRVEISTNGGSSWVSTPLAAYTGSTTTMAREQLDLSPYAGQSNVRIRFRLVTDSSVVMDGWYVDDVLIAEAPAPVTLGATLTNRNSAALRWTASAAPDFAAYRLYRAMSPGVDWRTARLVAEITTASTTNVTDITLAPKTTYHYRLAVVTTNGLLTLGNEIAVTTHPGMDYPFVDNGEAGPNTWIAEAPWALSAEDAASPTRAWSDSPGANYANGIPSQSLTLAAPLFFAGSAVSPVLSFNHKYDFASGDSANVEISTNAGASWTTLATFIGTATNTWRRSRISLAAYTNATALIRFRITTDPSANADGWHIDDISVAEAPTVINAPVLDQVTSHSIRVSWAANSDPTFSHYAVF
ncbi:MAG: immune inhibitor A, partial [Verrucomicrobiales bacterium]|nr:immune inhibitor A [Verrucomicrobiales bacterium]